MKKYMLIILSLLIATIIGGCTANIESSGNNQSSMEPITEYETEIDTIPTENETLSYEFNEETETLTISGTGEIAFVSRSAPWEPPYADLENPKHIIVSSGITGLAPDCFSFCYHGNTGEANNCYDKIETAEIADTVTYIGSGAFENCIGLKSIKLPKKLDTIEFSTFEGCVALEKIEIPHDVKSIGYSAFADCEGLKKVIVHDGVETIEAEAFENCSSLTELILPETLGTIKEYAFFGCTSMKSVNVPKNTNYIYPHAFGFYYDDNYELVKIDGFKIRGYKGTAAEKYAANFGFTFEALD